MSIAQNRMLLIVGTLLVGTALSSNARGDTPSFLKIFRPAKAAPMPAKVVMLTEEDGPWLILAHTFVGENSESRAERLTAEIRSELRLPAFVYHEKFDFTGNPGLTSRNRLRYANEYEYEAYAVLVGEYDSIDHPSINGDLKKLKKANLPVFAGADMAEEVEAKNPATTLKAMHQKLVKYVDRKQGPMASAFVTRNPKLPKEYFESPSIDSFVRQLNDDKDFSLLECKGKFTVVVRTFEGYGTIVDGRKEKRFTPSMERLDRFAVDAAKMVAELRDQGEEAYQFHDRNRSLVTVGSFDTLGRQLPGGRYEYSPEIRHLMKKYSALNNSRGPQAAPGNAGIAANHAAMIPFDVQPKPIAVPKSSKRSLYSAAFRSR